MDKQLYYKDEKGRYREYKDPAPPFDNALYRKFVNGKKVSYEPVSMLQDKDLGEGVWVVTKHIYGRSMTSGMYLRDMFMCQKASDIQDVPLSKLGGMDKLADYLYTLFQFGLDRLKVQVQTMEQIHHGSAIAAQHP